MERQNKFATNKQKQESGGTADTPNASAAAVPVTDKKKRGAPVGHPGWFRKPPTQYDWAVDVAAPKEFPHCSGIVRVFEEAAPAEHLQEDIIEGRYRVVLYRHEAARCEACGKWVQKAGDAEILNSRIGPHLRSTAIYLRNVIGISYRKIPQTIEELFGITFTPAALIGRREAEMPGSSGSNRARLAEADDCWLKRLRFLRVHSLPQKHHRAGEGLNCYNVTKLLAETVLAFRYSFSFAAK